MKIRVLVVEDNLDHRKIFSMQLHILKKRHAPKIELEYDESASAEEALAKSTKEFYDVILMDIHLGANSDDGNIVAEKIRGMEKYKVPKVKIYCISSDKASYDSKLMDSFLGKTSSVAALGTAILGSNYIPSPQASPAMAVFSIQNKTEGNASAAANNNDQKKSMISFAKK